MTGVLRVQTDKVKWRDFLKGLRGRGKFLEIRLSLGPRVSQIDRRGRNSGNCSYHVVISAAKRDRNREHPSWLLVHSTRFFHTYTIQKQAYRMVLPTVAGSVHNQDNFSLTWPKAKPSIDQPPVMLPKWFYVMSSWQLEPLNMLCQTFYVELVTVDKLIFYFCSQAHSS